MNINMNMYNDEEKLNTKDLLTILQYNGRDVTRLPCNLEIKRNINMKKTYITALSLTALVCGSVFGVQSLSQRYNSNESALQDAFRSELGNTMHSASLSELDPFSDFGMVPDNMDDFLQPIADSVFNGDINSIDEAIRALEQDERLAAVISSITNSEEGMEHAAHIKEFMSELADGNVDAEVLSNAARKAALAMSHLHNEHDDAHFQENMGRARAYAKQMAELMHYINSEEFQEYAGYIQEFVAPLAKGEVGKTFGRNSEHLEELISSILHASENGGINRKEALREMYSKLHQSYAEYNKPEHINEALHHFMTHLMKEGNIQKFMQMHEKIRPMLLHMNELMAPVTENTEQMQKLSEHWKNMSEAVRRTALAYAVSHKNIEAFKFLLSAWDTMSSQHKQHIIRYMNNNRNSMDIQAMMHLLKKHDNTVSKQLDMNVRGRRSRR